MGSFELPISIYKRHPLRFAVVHRQHGKQLRSAWTNPHPASIQDRDLSKDNVSIEACIVNYAKSDYPPAFSPLMKKDLVENLRLAPEWYDPSSYRSTERQRHDERTDRARCTCMLYRPRLLNEEGDEGSNGRKKKKKILGRRKAGDYCISFGCPFPPFLFFTSMRGHRTWIMVDGTDVLENVRNGGETDNEYSL